MTGLAALLNGRLISAPNTSICVMNTNYSLITGSHSTSSAQDQITWYQMSTNIYFYVVKGTVLTLDLSPSEGATSSWTVLILWDKDLLCVLYLQLLTLVLDLKRLFEQAYLLLSVNKVYLTFL